MDGFTVKNQIFKSKIRFCIADGQGRAWLKQVNPPNSKVCCERCLILSYCFRKRMVFSVGDEWVKRTDVPFKAKSDELYHKGTSTLETIMDMINQFPLKPLHLIDLGVMKRILKFLLEP